MTDEDDAEEIRRNPMGRSVKKKPAKPDCMPANWAAARERQDNRTELERGNYSTINLSLETWEEYNATARMKNQLPLQDHAWLYALAGIIWKPMPNTPQAAPHPMAAQSATPSARAAAEHWINIQAPNWRRQFGAYITEKLISTIHTMLDTGRIKAIGPAEAVKIADCLNALVIESKPDATLGTDWERRSGIWYYRHSGRAASPFVARSLENEFNRILKRRNENKL
jgi:hypothetical protein